MKLEARKRPTEQEIRRSKERELFQRLSWSGGLESAESDKDGNTRAGKITEVREGAGNWNYLGGTHMPENGEPAVLTFIFLKDFERMNRAMITLSYNDNGYISLLNSYGEELFSGKLYEDHKLNPKVKPAIDNAFLEPFIRNPHELTAQCTDFIDLYQKAS